MAVLPTESQLTSSGTTSADQKTNFAALRNFIADLLGTDSSNKAAARGALGLGNDGAVSSRSRIINGNFAVNQRAVSGTVTLSAGAYGHDRWKAGAAGCTYTFATAANVTTITISAGSLVQVVEGLNLQSGTHVLSWSGTAQGKIGAGSYGASGVTGAAVGGVNLQVEFGTGTVSKVQFEQGTIQTTFEQRHYGTELALCHRYYFARLAQIFQSYNAAGGINYREYHHPVVMRSAPSVVISNVTANNVGSLTLDSVATPTHVRFTNTTTATGSGYSIFDYTATAEL